MKARHGWLTDREEEEEGGGRGREEGGSEEERDGDGAIPLVDSYNIKRDGNIPWQSEK